MGTGCEQQMCQREVRNNTSDMKITISSELLAARLQNLGRVISPKSPMAILENFCIDIHDGVMDIMASDNEICIYSTLELNYCDEGQIKMAINARILQDVVKEIPDQPITFIINEETLEIQLEYANGHFQLVGTPADDYPTPPAEEPEILDDMVVVGSDGHKLAMTTLTEIKSERAKVAIVSKKHAGIIKAAMAREEGDIQLHIGERGLALYSVNYTINCSLVEGMYPKYSLVIPKENNNILTINRPALVSALRRVLIMSAGNANSLARLSISRSNVEVTSQDLDYARSGEENVLCEYEGMPMNIGFKGVFLVELLANLTQEEINIKLSDPSRAALILPVAEDETEKVLMLIMPMMLAD